MWRCIIRTYGGTEEAELHIFGSQGKAEVRKRDFIFLGMKAERKSGSETLDLWQSRQSRSAEVELHIFGSPGRDEMQKWTYPSLEVLAEQVRKMNEIFRRPGRAEVRKAELPIFASNDRAELRKRSFRPLKVLAERKCGS